MDDQADVVTVVTHLLRRDGFEVVGTARDGQEGIEVVTSTRPDAVLLDLRMPRLDGESALPRILERAPSTMVAVLSAHLDADDAERLFRLGAFAAYSKGDLGRLPSVLTEDLEAFRAANNGRAATTEPPRYRRL